MKRSAQILTLLLCLLASANQTAAQSGALVDTSQVVSSISIDAQETIPRINRDLTSLTLQIPGVGEGRPQLPPPNGTTAGADQIDRFEFLIDGVTLDPNEEIAGTLTEHRWTGGVLNVVTRTGTNDFNQGILRFPDEDGDDSNDLRIRYYFDGLYIENVQKALSESASLAIQFVGRFEATDPWSELRVTAFRSDFSPIYSSTHRLGATYSGYLPRGDLGAYQVYSDIELINPSGSMSEFEVIPRDNSGMVEQTSFDGQTGNAFDLSVDPFSTQTLRFDPEAGGFKTSSLEFLRVEGAYRFSLQGPPIEINVNYNTWQDADTAQATLRGSAGLAPGKPGLVYTLPVRKTSEGFDSAFSTLNVTSRSASMSLYLYEHAADRPEDKTLIDVAPLMLDSFASDTRFALEHFDLPARNSFSGSVVIVSNGSLSVTPLTTYKGFQVSSQPGGVSFIP